jgi:hypothetical protein
VPNISVVCVLCSRLPIEQTKRTHRSRSCGKHMSSKSTGYTGPTDEEQRPHGRGQQAYGDGSTYTGEFVHGTIDGRGTMRYATGAVFVGHFVGGVRHGAGRYTWACGSVFTGGYDQGQREGPGAMTFSKQAGEASRAAVVPLLEPSIAAEVAVMAHYKGDFKRNQPHGAGTVTYTSGAVYEGALRDGVEHGSGRLLLHRGTLQANGSWRVGAFQGPVLLTDVARGASLAVVKCDKGLVVDQYCGAASKTAGNPWVVKRCRRDGGAACAACGLPVRAALSDWLLAPPRLASPDPVSEDDAAEAESELRTAGPASCSAHSDVPASSAHSAGPASNSAHSDGGATDAAEAEANAKEAASTDAEVDATGDIAVTNVDAVAADDAAGINAIAKGKLDDAVWGLWMAVADFEAVGGGTVVRVVEVAPDSTAAAMSIKRGDVILAVAGSDVVAANDMAALGAAAGSVVELTVSRKGKRRDVRGAAGCTLERADYAFLSSVVGDRALAAAPEERRGAVARRVSEVCAQQRPRAW